MTINIRGHYFCNFAILCELYFLNVGIILFFRVGKFQNLINGELIRAGWVGGGGAY